MGNSKRTKKAVEYKTCARCGKLGWEIPPKPGQVCKFCGPTQDEESVEVEKQISLRSSGSDEELEFTLGDLLGNAPLHKDTKLILKLGLHSGTYGSSFAVAELVKK